VPATCIYITEIVCYIKRNKEILEQNTVHAYNMLKKLDLHILYCKINPFFFVRGNEYRN